MNVSIIATESLGNILRSDNQIMCDEATQKCLVSGFNKHDFQTAKKQNNELKILGKKSYFAFIRASSPKNLKQSG